MHYKSKIGVMIAGSMLLVLSSFCQLRLPSLISDGMILQRDTKIKIWGWASAKEKVTIEFLQKKYSTQAGADGKWTIPLPAHRSGGPYNMKILASNTIIIKDILFGDVWLCSGQSNMVHQLNIHDVTYAADIATANYPQIRQFLVPNVARLSAPADSLPGGSWVAAVGEAVRPFSAVAFFFAKKLYEQYKVPVGIINASVGGTPIEAWISEEGLKNFPEPLSTLQKNKDSAYVNSRNREVAAFLQKNNPPYNDKGLLENIKWYDSNYVPKGWQPVNIPGYWEDQGIKNLDGVVWYRKEIIIPASMAGQRARLFLGRIVDADIVYINGKEAGRTTYQYPQRRYHLPAGVLKAGKNTIVVRVTNTAARGGFVPGKPYYLFAGTDTVDLKGTWLYKVGDVFPPRQAPPVAGINPADQPAASFNAMIAPLINYAVKGFVWYQGESNTSRASGYTALQAAQISDWRRLWQSGDIPFLFVQLPNFMETNFLPSESQWAQLRDAQLQSLAVPNTAMAVTIDLGEWNDLHPDNKKDVGERLALAASKLAYGDTLEYAGPVFESAKIEENKITLSFLHTGSGIVTNDGEAPREFAIAGADKKFVWATAIIRGNNIIVWSDAVNNPLFVRYAWADNPRVNVYNKEGLPAAPFKTDK